MHALLRDAPPSPPEGSVTWSVKLKGVQCGLHSNLYVIYYCTSHSEYP